MLTERFDPALHPHDVAGRWARTTGGRALSTKAYQHAVANGGITVDEPHSGYAVALSKNTERKIDLQHFTPAVVKDYMTEHEQELSQPGAHLGIWEQDGDMYIDISYVGPPDKETLLKAQKAQQLAVFDLATMTEIPTGTITGGHYEPKALDRSVGRPPPGRVGEDPGGAARGAAGGGRHVQREDPGRVTVGYPGAGRAEGLIARGSWDPAKHHRRPKGIAGGGQFAPSWSGVTPRKQAPPTKPAPRRPEADEAVITVDDFLHGKGPAPTDAQVELLIEAHNLAAEHADALRKMVAARRELLARVQAKVSTVGRVKKGGYQATLEAQEKAGTITAAGQKDLANLRRSTSIPIGVNATAADRALAFRLFDESKVHRLPKGVHGGGRFGHGLGAPAVSTPGKKAAANVDAWLAENGSSPELLREKTRKLLDEATPESTAAGMGWYELSRGQSVALGGEYGVPERSALAAVAALSPRCVWDGEPEKPQGNLGKARRVFAASATPDNQPMTVTPEMWTKARKGLGSDKGLMPEARRSAVVGTHPAGELTDTELAVFHPGITGTILPAAKARAMRAARGHAEPDTVLGGLKIRSFFDNLDQPDVSTEVTIDSHQIRAMFDDIALPDKVYDGMASNEARYLAFADAVRDVAKERGILPSQVQAIMWTEWKRRYGIGDRRLANRADLLDHETIPQAEYDKLVALGEEVVALSAEVNGTVSMRFDEHKIHRLPSGEHGGGQFTHLPGTAPVSVLTTEHHQVEHLVDVYDKAQEPDVLKEPKLAPDRRYPRQVSDTDVDGVISTVMTDMAARYPTVSMPWVWVDSTDGFVARKHAEMATTPSHTTPELVREHLQPGSIYLHPLFADRYRIHNERMTCPPSTVATRTDSPDDNATFARLLLEHEMGHHLANQLGSYAELEALDPFERALATDDRHGLFLKHPERMLLKDPAAALRIHDELSPYAALDPREALAEAFAAGLKAERNGQQPNEWSKHVLEVFDRALGGSSDTNSGQRGGTGQDRSDGGEAEATARPGRREAGRIPVGYPGATRALHLHHHFDEHKIHRKLKGTHGGGQFTHLPGTGDLESVGGEDPTAGKFSPAQPLEKKQSAGAYLHGLLHNWHNWPDLPEGGGHEIPSPDGDFTEHYFELLAKDAEGSGGHHPATGVGGGGSKQVKPDDLQLGDQFVVPFGPQKGEVAVFEGSVPHETEPENRWVDYHMPGDTERLLGIKIAADATLQQVGKADAKGEGSGSSPEAYPKQHQWTVADQPIAAEMARLQAQYPRAPQPDIYNTDESRRYFANRSAYAATISNAVPSGENKRDAQEKGVELDSIMLNPNFFSNRVEFAHALARTRENPILTMHADDVTLDPNGGIDEQAAALVTHEYAHYLANHLTPEQHAKLYAPFRRALAQHNIGEAGMGFDFDEPDLAAALYVHVSPYAAYISPEPSLLGGEAVAEAFTRGQLQQQGKLAAQSPNPWADHVLKVFKEAYG